jgi:ABC-type branched-subunit amino acid transport system substrate-binding protein
MRKRILAATVAFGLLVTACGNSGESDGSSNTTTAGNSPGTTAAPDYDKNVPVDAPGVTDTEIQVAVITAATNPLGGHYKELQDGIQAYFDKVNDAGGLYGRQLKIGAVRDDKFSANQTEVKASLAQDNAFATFVATAIFTGATDLAAANHPTFIWNINPEFAGKPNMFANIGALCFTCTGQFLPWLAKENNFKTVGILAYGVSDQSKQCADGAKASFEKFTPDIEVGFFDKNIQYAQADLSAQVSAMKDAGVEFVTTCMDQRETLILAKEMDKQGLNAVQNLPNGYDAEFVKDNAQYFEGSFVSPLFVPFEKEALPKEMADLRSAIDAAGKQMYELTVVGWIIAHEFVTGLKLAGPEFNQQKVIDALNGVTSYSADGTVAPIDWTKQHNSADGHPEFEGDWECNSVVRIEGGEFVPVYDEPDKPWVCFEGGPEATELTENPEFRTFEGMALDQ